MFFLLRTVFRRNAVRPWRIPICSAISLPLPPFVARNRLIIDLFVFILGILCANYELTIKNK